MLQIVISLFLIVVGAINADPSPSSFDIDAGDTRDPTSINQIKATEYALKKTAEAKKLLTEVNRRVPNWCFNELENISSTERNLLQARERATPQFVTSQNNTTEEQLLLCSRNISGKIMNIKHPISQESWYIQYLAEKKYLKDFERYPELERQFNKKMNPAHQQFMKYSAQNEVYTHSALISIYLESHPYFQDPNLPKAYNDMLSELKKRNSCDSKEAETCHENLKRQLAEDSKDGLKAVCRTALMEGQACCANPNRSCGNFAFAKDISKAFAKNLLPLSQAFANLYTIKGNAVEACKLSQLRGVVAPLGNLQIDSCNKAIDGCRETCQTHLDKFKKDFKQCYKISENKSLREIIQNAGQKKLTKEDPQYKCQDKIREIAEAYKENSLESRYSLSEDSDHEEWAACYNEIESQARGGHSPGGMNPTQQLAVSMCYGHGNSAAPYTQDTSPTPVGTAGPAPVSIGSFAGAKTKDIKSPTSPYDEGGNPYALGPEDENWGDLGNTRGKGLENNDLKFQSTGNSGGPGGSGALAGGGGVQGPSSTGSKGRGTASAGTGKNKQIPFFTGDLKHWNNHGGSWGAEDDAKYLRQKAKAAELRKLPSKYLTDEEKDLVKMFSKVGKWESIFERASFALHWFCRNYGCVGYAEAMGITYPEVEGFPSSFLLIQPPLEQNICIDPDEKSPSLDS